MLTGKRREGIFAGVMTFVRKAVQAVALFGVGLLLQHYGFTPKSATQPVEAVYGITLVFGAGSVIFLLVGLYSSMKFRLTRHNHALLVSEIERLKAGGSKYDVTPEARLVAEQLTGWPYEKCWGDNNILIQTEELSPLTPDDLSTGANHAKN